MANEEENSEILGTRLVFFADGLFALSATVSARAEESQDEDAKKACEYLAVTFNVIGAWVQLLGDYLLFQVVQKELEDNLNSAEPFDEQAGRLEVLVAGSQVALDILEVQLAERAAEIVR